MSKLKNFFQKTKAGRILRSVGLGVVDSVAAPYGGLVKGVVGGVKSAINNNINDAVTEEGQIDWIRILTFIGLLVVVVYVTWQLFTGNMTLDQVLDIFKEIGIDA